jgi:hypothetical protein
MKHSVIILGTLALLSTIGCGPPLLAGDLTDSDDDTDSGEASSDSTSTSTTSMETSEDDSVDDSTDDNDVTSNGFIFPFEDIGEAVECNEFAQDCPEGEKCVPYVQNGGLWDANKCVAVTGDGQPGEPCVWGGPVEATDDCDETSMCFDVMQVDGQWFGTCHAFCTGTPDNPECPEDGTCLVDSNGYMAVCVQGCSPLLQDCNPEFGCYWDGVGFVCAANPTGLATGEPCDFVNDCAPGHLCTPDEALPSCEGASCCTPFCDLEVGDEHCQTLPGTSCVPFFAEGEELPGYELVGVCTLPP